LIELLVVIAIIAILVAMLLPAVQQVREAARKSQCQDHLHNVGIAIMDYEGTHMALPLNYDPTHAPGQAGAAISWIYMTLPFIEQKPLYDSINLDNWPTDPNAGGRGLTIPANDQAFKTPLSVMMCPSNPQNAVFSDAGGDGAAVCYDIGGWNGNGRYVLHARTDYSGNMGWVWTGWKDCGGGTGGQNGSTWKDPGRDIKHRDLVREGGAFWWRGNTTVADYVDGLSNTIIVFENHHWRDSGKFPGEINKAYAWSSPIGAIDALHLPINDNPSWNDDTRCSNWSSTHAGGAQAVAGDAKVFFASENMDLGVMRGISTRSGAETVKLP
jgi:type II secretory pathway pseudopilin PulG